MYDQAELTRLVDVMRENGVTILEVEADGELLRLVLPPATETHAKQPPTPALRRTATASPGIGIFMPRGVDDGLPLLAAGGEVMAGEVLGYICQGPARVPIIAPASGVLWGNNPEEGVLFGYGDTIFIVETSM